MQQDPFWKSIEEIGEMTPFQVRDLLNKPEDLEAKVRYQKASPEVRRLMERIGYHRG